MSMNLDKSLDEIIADRPKSGGRGRGGRGGRARGGRGRGNRGGYVPRGAGGYSRPFRRTQDVRRGRRPAPYATQLRVTMENDAVEEEYDNQYYEEEEYVDNTPARWGHDLYEHEEAPVRRAAAPRAAAPPAAYSSAENKILISNLALSVSDDDVRDLFSEVGTLKSSALLYTKDGKSTGTAHVQFNSAADAIEALKKYDGVALDGKPMKIEIVGAPSEPPRPVQSRLSGMVSDEIFARPAAPRRVVAAAAAPMRRVVSGGGGARGRARGGRGRGRGSGGAPRAAVTSESLDDELDAYRNAA